MAGKPTISPAQYQALIDAYREVGNNALRIARITGRNRQTVTRALRYGYPELGFPPIHQPHRPAIATEAVGTGASAPTTSAGGAATGTDGLTSKQSGARAKEQDAIFGAMQNLVGSTIATTHILQKLIEQAPSILSKITGTGEDAISPREYVRLIRELSKANRESSDSLAKLMAAGRLNTGEAQTISETRHTGNVGVSVEVNPETEAEQKKRFEHMLDIHARARAYAAGPGYVGEEAGIVDVESTPADGLDLGELNKPVALTSLRESGGLAEVATSAVEAESRARRALAARGMPDAQIERTVDRAKAKAERDGRALASVIDEMLGASPGQASANP